MKTDAIRNALRYADKEISCGLEIGNAAEAELSARETALEVKDKAAEATIRHAPSHGPLWHGSAEINALRAALSPPTGKEVR